MTLCTHRQHPRQGTYTKSAPSKTRTLNWDTSSQTPACRLHGLGIILLIGCLCPGLRVHDGVVLCVIIFVRVASLESAIHGFAREAPVMFLLLHATSVVPLLACPSHKAVLDLSAWVSVLQGANLICLREVVVATSTRILSQHGGQSRQRQENLHCCNLSEWVLESGNC